jgi:hypothetical protein
MKHKLLLSSVLLIATSLVVPCMVKAQMSRVSPHDTVTSVVSDAHIRIIFGSPAVKGREIWGGLVPYDKAWRGGADEATLFTTDKDVMIGGKKLPAGTYSVFVVPAKDKWTYIFNSQTGQWGIKQGGAANFDESKNVLSVTATPKPAPMSEHLTYQANDKGFGLHWEKTEALVPIK